MKPFRLAAVLVLLGLAACEPSSAAASTKLTMTAPVRSITASVYDDKGQTVVAVNPIVLLQASGAAFEVQVTRPAYDRPIVARAFLGTTWRTVPLSLLDEWDGFNAFTLTWRNSGGRVISTTSQDWCPNRGALKRVSSGSPQSSRYARVCGTHPFSKGQRWGVEGGWAVQALGGSVPAPALTPGSTYRLTVHLNSAVGTFLGIVPAARDIVFTVKAVRGTDRSLAPAPADEGAPSGGPGPVTSRSSRTARSVPVEPHGTSIGLVTKADLPDLVALPAIGIGAVNDAGIDQLEFSSTVWNAGTGPLVIDGYRQGSTNRANGHQLFFRNGRQIGTADVSAMMYDEGQSHLHWHMVDFAQYDLIDAAGRQVAKAPAKGFCIAPTDPIDLLVKGAPANPGNGNLATACGDVSSVYVREVLVTGWGDTYTQRRVGNSIDISHVPNGTYRLRVKANSDSAIREVTKSNNVSLRTVVLGGTAGHRTWKVPPYKLIDSEAKFGPISPG